MHLSFISNDLDFKNLINLRDVESPKNTAQNLIMDSVDFFHATHIIFIYFYSIRNTHTLNPSLEWKLHVSMLIVSICACTFRNHKWIEMEKL